MNLKPGGEQYMSLIIPKDFNPRLSIRETEEAIKYIRDTFQKEFGKEMNLERISAPLFVEKSPSVKKSDVQPPP